MAMMKYSDFRPTQFDRHIALDGREDWFVLGVGQNRDSDVLARSNFECVLRSLGGESETVEVHRFDHWGPGWFEIILLAPEKEKEGLDIEAALADYPVFDDEHYIELQSRDNDEDWRNWLRRDLVQAITRRFNLSQKAEDLLDESEEFLYRFHSDRDSGEFYNLNYVRILHRDEVAELLRDCRKAMAT